MLLATIAQGIGVDHKADHHQTDENGHVDPRRFLNVAGHVAQYRHAEADLADDVAFGNQGLVHVVVGVALGAEQGHGGVGFIGHQLHDAVGSHHIGGQAEGDDVVDAQGTGVHILDVDERADGIGGLHGAGQHAVDLEAKQAHAGNEERQNDGKDHQQRGQALEKLCNLFVHKAPLC